MKQELLCMGCMAPKGKTAVCSRCGYFDRPPENPQQLPPRTILENKYVVGRVLGQGGFGITYLGYDLELNKKLAIKEYFPLQISTRAGDHLTVNPISTKNRQELEYGLNKFADEARALTQFKKNPGVVSILDFLYAHGTAYIVMEYVDGRDLKDYLHQHGGKISFEAALKIILLVMAALEDVHRTGIIHRDISPDNIYVEANGGIKILDFGATRYAMGEQSRSLSVVLKPGYAPEEQYRGKGRQGSWTDIYALGATFYRAITGFVPPDALDRLIEDELVPPSLRVAVPAYADAALLKALALKAENRFQTVAEFREALMPHIVVPQSVARPVEPTPVPPKPVVDPRQVSIVVQPPQRLSKIILLPAFSMAFLIFFIGTSAEGKIWGPQLLAAAALFGLMMFVFARMWSAIQDGHARVAPDNAIAYCFIPGFNLYWAFPVLWGFAKDYNRFLDRHLRTAAKLKEQMFFACSLTYSLGCLVAPFNGFLASLFILVNACLLLPVLAMICDAVNALGFVAEESRDSFSEKPFSLHCLSGEYAGQNASVNLQGMVMGRNASRASFVFSSGEVSAQHVRVWQDAANAGVWIEDLKSTNGTYFCRSRSEGRGAEWTRLAEKKLLYAGDSFRLSTAGPEFEVKAA
jgi:serine/threonine protein kinase